MRSHIFPQLLNIVITLDQAGQAGQDTWAELGAVLVKRDVTNPAFDRHKELSIFHFDQIDFKYA